MKRTCKPGLCHPQPQVNEGSAGVSSVCQCRTVSGMGPSAGYARVEDRLRVCKRQSINIFCRLWWRRWRLQHLHVVLWDEAPPPFQLALQPARLPGRSHCGGRGGGRLMRGDGRLLSALCIPTFIFLLFLQRAIFPRISPLNLRSIFFFHKLYDRCVEEPNVVQSSQDS